MSDSSDSDEYSSRLLNKNKKNDENLLASKNKFMKELQNHSNMSHVAQKSFLQANESFVNEFGKRKLKNRDEAESDLNISETNKRKKVGHGGMKDVMENGPDEFVTVREVAKKKHKKKHLGVSADGNFEDVHEESNEKKSKKKNYASLPTELDGFEGGESVPKQGGSSKKHKKHKKRPNDKSESHDFVDESFNLQLEASSSNEQEKRKNSKITSIRDDRPDSSINDSIQDLLKVEQRKLSIPNIQSQVAEELTSSASKKKKKEKKVRLESENTKKVDRVKDIDVADPDVRIIENFQKNKSLQKVDFCESSSLHKLKENRPSFFVEVPVDLDPIQLIGTNISLNKDAKMEIGGSKYKSSAQSAPKEPSFVVLGEQNQVRLKVSHLITIRSKNDPSRTRDSSDKEDMIKDLLLEQENIINTPKKQRKTKLEKSLVKSGGANKMEQLDIFLKNGTKFLEDVKFVSFRFKNEKLMADLDRQTNEVLKKQVEFLQGASQSTAKYRKMKKELADETRELLQKRVNIMKKVGNDGELSDYF